MSAFDPLKEKIKELKIPPLPNKELLDNYRINSSSSDDDNERREEGDERYKGEYKVRKKAHEISCNFVRRCEEWKFCVPETPKEETLRYYYLFASLCDSLNCKENPNNCRGCQSCNGKAARFSDLIVEALNSLVELLLLEDETSFPFCGEAYRAMAYIFIKIGIQHLAFQCLEYSNQCYHYLGYPLLTTTTLHNDNNDNNNETEATTEDDDQIKLSWNNPNDFYFLHNVATNISVLAVTQGKHEESIQLFYKLMRWTSFQDDANIRYNMLYLMFQHKLFHRAEQLAKIDFDMRNDTVFLHGMLMQTFIHYKEGKTSIVRLEKSLYRAVQSTQCIITLILLHGDLMPTPRDTLDMAIANLLRKTWESIEGLNDWVRSMVFVDGFKPPSARDMFSLLNSGVVMIQTYSPSDRIIATLDVSLMPNTDSSFQFKNIPTGTKCYPSNNNNNKKLVMYRIPSLWPLPRQVTRWKLKGWIGVKYNNIKHVPFWKLILRHGPFPRTCSNTTCDCSSTTTTIEALFDCSQCRAVSYCSKVCQKEDWKQHRQHCQRLTKKI